MNLENTVKYHFAKSTLISDSPRATASDSLTGTDIMAYGHDTGTSRHGL